jgi:S-sulfo-L-cysteine synthase (3-phospho-L-serine-dependent)
MLVGMIFYVVEAQLSDAGLRPVTVARRLGLTPVFVTNRLDRYSGLLTFDDVLRAPDSETLTTDTNNADAVTAAIRAHGGNPAGVFTMCDYNLPIVSWVAAEFGLPGLDPQAAWTCRHKLRTRQTLQAAGLPTPRYANPTTAEELRAALAYTGLPCIVKPMTESASVDVRLCYDADDVLRQFQQIVERTHDARGQLRPPGVLVEEYLVGYEMSVETVCADGEALVLGVSDKRLGPAPVFAEIGDVSPSLLPAPVVEACAAAALNGLNAVGHSFGCAHTEIRVVDGTPVIVEINARLGGDEVADLIQLTTGIDILEQSIRLHVGQSTDFNRTLDRGASSSCFSPQISGVVTAIHGVEIAEAVPGVTEVVVGVRPGDVVQAASSNHATFGRVVASADSAAEAFRLADFAASQVHVQLDPGSATVSAPPATKGLDPE